MGMGFVYNVYRVCRVKEKSTLGIVEFLLRTQKSGL